MAQFSFATNFDPQKLFLSSDVQIKSWETGPVSNSVPMIAPNLESSLDLNKSVLEPLLCVKIKIDRRMKFYGLYKCSLQTDLKAIISC